MSTVAEYTSGAVSGSSGTVSGTVNVVSDTGFDQLQMPNNSTADYARFDVSAMDAYTVQFYLHTPAAWAGSAVDVFRGQVGATSIESRVTFGGSSQPGRVIMYRTSATVAAQSASGLLSVSSVYRVQMSVDSVADTMRLRIFNLGSDASIYDSGTVSAATAGSITRLLFGDNSNNNSLGTWAVSRIKVTNAVETLARHASDSAQLSTPVVVLGDTTSDSGAGDGEQIVTWAPVAGAASYDAYIVTGLGASETPDQEDFSLVAAGVSSPYTFTGLVAGRNAYGIKAKA